MWRRLGSSLTGAGLLLVLGALVLQPPAAAQTRPDRRVLVRAGGAPSGLGADETPAELAKLGLRVLRLAAETAAQAHAQPGFLQMAQPVWALDTVPDDPGWGLQYGPAAIQAPLAWDVTTGTLTVTIAIIDTGIDLTHPELAGKIISGTTFISGTTTPQDDHGLGHGTHVAGIAAAAGGNALGIAGINWGARLMPVKVLDRFGNGDDLDVAAGIIWAADHGADVINLSLGGPCPSPAMELAVTYAYTMGATVVAAAGNSGQAGVLCPAAAEQALAVAATGPSNDHAMFSTFGPEVDLAAPGVSIYSTKPGGQYGLLSGTSMAAPHVAGAAALLAGQPGFDTPAAIRRALEGSALDLGPVCRDMYYGAGLIQLRAALDYGPGQPAAPRSAWCHFMPSLFLESPITLLWLNPQTAP